MRGPGACPRPVGRIETSSGQAPGPRLPVPASHCPYTIPSLTKNDNGKAFAGFYRGTMVFKLTAPQHAEALALSGSHLFDPSGSGHPMKEWVEVPAEHASQWLELAQATYRYVEMIGK